MVARSDRTLTRCLGFKTLWYGGCASSLLFFAALSCADTVFVGKIYDPYVHPLETEVELHSSGFQGDGHPLDGSQAHLFSVGRAISERWFAEVGVEAERISDDLRVTAWEGELKWQLTEQGEYGVDWGLLFEAETETEVNIREVSASVIMLKEWSRWVGTVNAGLVYEYGSAIDNEWETTVATQMRYRWRRALEPGIEMFLSEGAKLLGPSLSGLVRLQGPNKLYWQTGVYAPLERESPDFTWRVMLEYEFY